MLELLPFVDFETASREALSFLHSRIGFDLWMVTRTEGDDWIVLQCEDHGYGVKEGDVFYWADSFCSQMVLGRGPRIAAKSESIPAYVAAPIGQQVPIGAYVGVPLVDGEGSLFGTLCAIDPTPQSEQLNDELPMVELISRLLSSLLTAELKLTAQKRASDFSSSACETDPISGLLTKSSWGRVVAAEERRCRLYGHPAGIVSIRIKELANQTHDDSNSFRVDSNMVSLAQSVGNGIRQTLGQADIAARFDRDLFAVIGAERNQTSTAELAESLHKAMIANGIEADIRFACRNPREGLEAAVQALFISELPTPEASHVLVAES